MMSTILTKGQAMFKRNEEVYVLVYMHSKPGKEEELLKALQVCVENSRKEAGCFQYEIVQSVTESRQITLIERFKDHEAFEHHGNQSYIKQFDEKLKIDLVDEFNLNLFSGINM